MQLLSIAVMDLVVTTVEEGIKVAYEALIAYEQLIEGDIPWEELKNSLDHLDAFRNGISNDSTLLVNELRAHMTTGIYAHFFASQNIYEWVRLTKTYLQLYIKLFDDHDAKKAESQSRIF